MMILVVLLIPLAGQKAILSSIENKTGVQFEYAMPNELLLAMGLQGDVAAGEVPGQYNAYTWSVYILVLIYFVYLLIGKISKNAEGERICVIQPANYLTGLVIIGGILFSAIWEAKSRYVYPYMVIAMPYMAGVAVLLAEWIRKLLSGVVIKYNLKLHVESFSKNIKNDLKKYIQERSLVDWLNIIILGIFVIAHGCLMYFLFYRQAIHYDEKYYTDISPYIFHMQGIDTGYDFPYPVMFWVGKFFWNFMNPERAMATAVTVFLSTLLTFTMLYVSMLFMDLSEGSR